MPKLILSMDGLVLKEIQLDRERITIGRKPINDIQIDNLAISGEHAVVTTILDDAFLEDRNSTNGTYVNGQSIKKHVLRDNDVIELGKYRLKYLAEPTRAAPPAYIDPVSHAAARGSRPPAATPAEGPERGQEPAAERGVGIVRVLAGPNVGRELELAKPLTTLGKPGLQVAALTRRQHGYFIAHVEGNALPLVNGAAIEPQGRPLQEHDVIEVAGVRMEFLTRR